MTPDNCRARLLRDLEQCNQEIAAAEERILSGHPRHDLVAIGIHDWATEKKIIEGLLAALDRQTAKDVRDEAVL